MRKIRDRMAKTSRHIEAAGQSAWGGVWTVAIRPALLIPRVKVLTLTVEASLSPSAFSKSAVYRNSPWVRRGRREYLEGS
jgi:hypothetical protein